MSKHRWGRSQKYHARERHLYALLFENGHAYIGQTVDLAQREAQHRRPAGGWGTAQFHFLPLGSVMGTEAVAKDYEHAWRHRAWKNGWAIYGKPGLRVNHKNQMTLKRYLLAWRLRWPVEYSRNWHWRLASASCMGAGALSLGYWML